MYTRIIAMTGKKSTIWSCCSWQNGFIRRAATDSPNRYNFCLWHLWYGCLSTNGAFITFVSQCRLFSWQSSVTVLDSLLESGHWGLRVWHKRAVALCVNGHINLAFNEHWWLFRFFFFYFFFYESMSTHKGMRLALSKKNRILKWDVWQQHQNEWPI